MKIVLRIGFELVNPMIVYSFKSNNIQPSNGRIHPNKRYFYKRKCYIINGFISMKTTFFVCIRPFLCYFLMVLKKLGNIDLSINLPTYITPVKTRSVRNPSY